MVDDMVGQVMQTLKEQGMDDNTLIIFTSDNGSHWKPSDIKKFSHRANADRRGMKSDDYDGGHRVPFIVKWGRELKAGSDSKQLICMTDIYATMSDILELPKVSGQGMDGETFLPYLLDPSKVNADRVVVHHSANGKFAIRKGQWKMIDCYGSGGWSDPSPSNKKDQMKVQLYDMKNDIHENENVAVTHPEIVKELKTELEKIKNK